MNQTDKEVICGRQVAPERAAGSSPYQGETYYFCSAGCIRKFDQSPNSTPSSRNSLGRLGSAATVSGGRHCQDVIIIRADHRRT